MPGVPKVGKIGKILNKDLVPFTRQLASMSAAGMTIMDSVMTLEANTKNPEFRKVVTYLRETIEGGQPISDGMAEFPRIFDDMYVNMVRAGEQSGEFESILHRLALIVNSASKLRKKIKGALTYPIVVTSLALTIAFCLIQFVVPVFAKMFSDFGRPLPGLTQALVDMSEFTKNWWFVILPALAAAIWLFVRWKRTEAGRLKFDTFKLRIPVMGELAQKGAVARLCRLLSEMLGAGMPILKALKVVSGAFGNRALELGILAARDEVEQGRMLHVALEGKPFMPDMLVRMLAAGEKSGRMQDMLGSVADTYEDEVEAMIAQLTALMEPFIMIFMGLIIGTIVVALFLPIFQLGSVVG